MDGGLRRLQRDLKLIQAEPCGVYVTTRGDDLALLDALVLGPQDTPYDGAMLHFQLKVSNFYPMNPPEVQFLTTDSNKLRLHPQLYADGKVCLSILGTWHGPRWTASSSIRTVLLSIQSLLCEDPLRCEPGMEAASDERVELANVFVVHESVRVGILPMLEESPTWGTDEAAEVLSTAARAYLSQRLSTLLRRLSSLATRFDGQVMREPFNFGAEASTCRRYDFEGLARRLQSFSPQPEHLPPASSESEKAESKDDAVTSLPEEEEALCCRICHLTLEESETELIEPCQCAGSIRCAHSSCLIDWLKHTGAAQGEWRCDLCLAPFEVRSAPGQPPGTKLLRRSLLEFVDMQLPVECCGLVSILLTSICQTLLMCLCSGIANILYLAANVLLSPVGPSYDVLKWPLAVPAVLLDLTAMGSYVLLVGVKVAMLVRAAESRCIMVCCELQEQLLVWVAEMLTLLWNIRLAGLLALTSYFTADHLCRTCLGVNLLLVAEWPLFGHKPEVISFTSFSMRANSPAQILRSFSMSCWVYQGIGVASALVNLLAILLLLKAAFLDARSVPVAILTAEKLKKE
ncbi:unnamed protein product [Effrenium voratum]|uniref:Ubiquitin-conjugating enzyme E2 Z n=1 Tax=Effrenium voratum TaxID=2562239 RepID=A0AA36MTQ5_9DINO|nr:unnamed protein product [Effrenium voratum]CAJ1444087.1 unnamed protein product [Effrenium voratum]